jgi:cell division protein FtsN
MNRFQQQQQQFQRQQQQQIEMMRHGINAYMASKGQAPRISAVGVAIVIGVNLLVLVGILSQIQQEKQDTQKWQQQSCETWPNPANRPPWCN